MSSFFALFGAVAMDLKEKKKKVTFFSAASFFLSIYINHYLFLDDKITVEKFPNDLALACVA